MIQVSVNVACDDCFSSVFDADTQALTAADAKLAAWQLGWLTVDGQHFCPDCIEKTKTPDMVESHALHLRRTGGSAVVNRRAIPERRKK